jgi:hypothetical protein
MEGRPTTFSLDSRFIWLVNFAGSERSEGREEGEGEGGGGRGRI